MQTERLSSETKCHLSSTAATYTADPKTIPSSNGDQTEGNGGKEGSRTTGATESGSSGKEDSEGHLRKLCFDLSAAKKSGWWCLDAALLKGEVLDDDQRPKHDVTIMHPLPRRSEIHTDVR